MPAFSHFLASASSKRRFTPKYRNGNPIWKFFYVADPKNCFARCNECGKDFARGYVSKNTSNLRTHLKCKHSQLYQELLRLCEIEKLPPQLHASATSSDGSDGAVMHNDIGYVDSVESIGEPMQRCSIEPKDALSLINYCGDGHSVVGDNASLNESWDSNSISSLPGNNQEEDNANQTLNFSEKDNGDGIEDIFNDTAPSFLENPYIFHPGTPPQQAGPQAEPNAMMSAEELQKHLLLAKIEREKAVAKCYNAGTLAILYNMFGRQRS